MKLPAFDTVRFIDGCWIDTADTHTSKGKAAVGLEVETLRPRNLADRLNALRETWLESFNFLRRRTRFVGATEGFEGNIGNYHNYGGGTSQWVPWAESFPTTGFPAGTPNKIKGEGDSSIGRYFGIPEGFEGCEYPLPPVTGDLGLRYIETFLRQLRESGHRVNGDCGLHIHVGLKSIVGDADCDDVVAFLAQLNKLVYNYQDAFYAQTGTRRDRREYCQRMDNDNSGGVLHASRTVSNKPKGSKTDSDYSSIARRSTKYRFLNLTKLRGGTDHPTATIEFRCFAGTLNFTKVLMHIRSVLWLCRLAWKSRHSGHGDGGFGWELTKPMHRRKSKAGVASLDVMLSKMNRSSNHSCDILGESQVMTENKEAMEAKARQMAVKYDARFTERSRADMSGSEYSE